jgi:hypothetical protein
VKLRALRDLGAFAIDEKGKAIGKAEFRRSDDEVSIPMRVASRVEFLPPPKAAG